MTTIVYEHADGSESTILAKPGDSVMRTAVLNNVPGIVAECGGNAMCATCHVYVAPIPGLPDVADAEDEMLDCTAEERGADSRLSCQLPAVDGLRVRIPETQI